MTRALIFDTGKDFHAVYVTGKSHFSLCVILKQTTSN